MLCEECCRKELESYVSGENNFNIAFKNCESILCKRKSVQSVLGVVLLIILLINIIDLLL
uniref:ORF87 n=1 Tax=Pieris brassicae granulosis virus TaxID=10465 RepID=A0A7G9U8M6_GVPB|nr:ORF87 [Pieris brassicae granulovirus]